MRFGRITGSICYNLFTYAKNKNPDWNKKLKSVFNSSFKGTEDTVYGLMCEPEARDCFERDNPESEIVQIGILINPLLPWLGYSADGIVCTNKSIENKSLWECKALKLGKKKCRRTENCCKVFGLKQW